MYSLKVVVMFCFVRNREKENLVGVVGYIFNIVLAAAVDDWQRWCTCSHDYRR
jgi:hypothetical protein